MSLPIARRSSLPWYQLGLDLCDLAESNLTRRIRADLVVQGLDDLCVRFIVNLPKEELESVERICFQVEEAQWFYEDFIRPLDPNLPSLNLRQFCLRIFQHCPLLSGFSSYHHATAFSEFLAYKTRVPVRGAIMLNEAMDEVVLVKGWKKNANWSFPRGKINKDEKDIDCAIREVYEETGFDIHAANLVGNEEDVKYIEVTMREQHMRLYVFRGVPMDTIFEPRTRKEISKIQWYKLSELPTLKKMRQQQQEGRGEDLAVNANKFYMVAPFLVPLKKWISQQKKLNAMNSQLPEGDILRQGDIEPPVDQALESNIILDLPQMNDMSRLMTQLRQSGQTTTTSDVAELSGPETSEDASAHLKSLLHVPSHTEEPSAMRKAADSRQEKANAMLSLLRSGGSAKPDQSNLSSHPPQTPFEQILGVPPLPPSPKHQSSRPADVASLPPPPTFPYSPTQIRRQGNNQPVHATGHITPGVRSTRYSAFQQPASNTTQPGQFLPYSMPQRSNQVLAPYQRTGDPQFAEGPRHAQNLPSSIPPANALPPPKLTTHSSALLEIFKTGTLSKPSATPLQSRTSVVPQEAPTHLEQNASSQQSAEPPKPLLQRESVIDRQQAAVSTVAALPPATPPIVSASRPRNEQQENLLSLFRNPSTPAISKVHTSSPSLAPPTTLVELSAQPSPSHSRVSSDIKRKETKPQLSNGSVTIQKRPDVSTTKAGQTPVSATVTGPLHFPQFDKIHRRPKEHAAKATNGSLDTQAKAPKSQTVPMSILPRPVAEAKHPSVLQATQSIQSRPMSGEKQKATSVLQTPEWPKELLQERVRVPSNPPSAATERKVQSQPFQPQILRRPANSQSGLDLTSLMSSISGPAAPSASAHFKQDNYLDGRRTSQTQEHKSALLSLFNKSQSVLAPPTPSFNSLVSPLSERPARAESALPSPIDLSRGRLGSMASMLDDDVASGSGMNGNGSGRQTPQTSPVDKQFLLGYLADVVRGAK